MSTELYEEAYNAPEAVNDDAWTLPGRPARGALCARRRVEALLEERRLARDLSDDWAAWDEEE
ncbi:hypothetical protein M1D97_12065 [Kushneria sp. AK178]